MIDLTREEATELVSLLNQGRYGEAEIQARELTQRYPLCGFAWKVLGAAQSLQSKDALPALQKATELLPHDAEAHGNLGVALLDAGRIAEAEQSFRRALQHAPDRADFHTGLANALRHLGRLSEAVQSYERAVQLAPAHARLHHNLAAALHELHRSRESLAHYQQAITLEPECAEAHAGLASALHEVGRLEDAVASLRRAIEIEPLLAGAHGNLGNVLLELGRSREALAAYQQEVALTPASPRAHINLATAQRLLGRTEEAQSSCRKALEIDPRSGTARVVLADAHADRGEFTEAEELLRSATELEPDSPEAWAAQAHLRRMSTSDASWLQQSLRVLARTTSARQQALLHYALGKYFDDIGEFDAAFAHYRRANELTKQRRTPHDQAQMTATVNHLMREHDAAFLAQARGRGIASARPVFIVGMPRSGTSLAEQILASHPQVFGAGELTFWGRASAARAQSASASAVQIERLRVQAIDYLHRLAEISPSAARVIDKMPTNFLHLGAIHAALPEARIIHLQRHPIDTCLSIYFQDFTAALPYSNDLQDLAHHYGEYSRIMNHWRAVLPPQSLLDVPYEQLVDDCEAWSRRMLEFIGLPWDCRCLDFHQTTRRVLTASKWQVRQKLHRAAVGRWHNYERYAGPLRHLLDYPDP